MLGDSLDIESAFVDDGALAFGDCNHPRTLCAKEGGGVIADIPQALHDDALALESGGQAERRHVGGIGACGAKGMYESAARRFCPALDAALSDRLAGHARDR